MRDQSFYLGDPGAHRNLTWMATEYGDVVVKNYSSSPSNSTSGDHVVRLAVLLAIVELTPEDFRLSSDGYWRESTYAAPALADVVLSCTGTAAFHEELTLDFLNVVHNIDMLINESRDFDHRISSCCLLSASTLETKVKFCHVLFQVRMI
jgi:hypothetical protein